MKKVIRLTESDLTRIVKRVIEESKKSEITSYLNEGQMSQQTIKMASDSFKKCFNPKSYPELWKVAKGSLGIAAALFFFFMGGAAIFAGGGALATILGGFPPVLGGTVTSYLELQNLYTLNFSKIKKELSQIKKCAMSTASSVWNFVPNTLSTVNSTSR
jgi:hypothetical protein